MVEENAFKWSFIRTTLPDRYFFPRREEEEVEHLIQASLLFKEKGSGSKESIILTFA